MHLNCAQCGGKVPLSVESPFAACPYCSCNLYIYRARCFRHLGLPARLGAAAAKDLVREEAKRPLQGALEISAVVLPFWSVRGENLQETFPAFSPVPMALEGFRLPAGQPSWFRAQDYPGHVVVEVPEEARISWDDLEPETQVSVYSVPFFRIAYDEMPERQEAWVDASASRVFWGFGPPAAKEADASRLVTAMAAITGLFTLEAFLLPGGWLPVISVAGTGVLSYPWLRAFFDPQGRP